MEEMKLVKVVELPEFEDIKGKEVGEAICNLFRHLIPEDMERPVDVEPKKIKLNYCDSSEYVRLIQDELGKENAIKVSLAWLNQGPSADKDIPRGKIYLYEGFIKQANNHERVG